MLKAQANRKNKQWFAFKNMDSSMPTLDIFDEIGGWGTWADEVVAQLDNITASSIKVRLYSPGGYVDEGMQIYVALKRHSARIVIEIDSQAASIASVIAMAGDEIHMADTAFMMIHNPWGGCVGDSEEMRKTADVLDQFKASIIKAYQKRTGLDEAKLVELMNAETWMNAEMALDYGFIDVIDTLEDEQPAQASFSNKIVGAFNHVPEALRGAFAQAASASAPTLMLSPKAMARIDKDSAAAENKAGAMPEKKQVEVTMSDTKTTAPVDTAAVKNKAQRNERERMNEIIARGDRAHDLVGKAKAEALVREALNTDATPEQFSAMLMDAAEERAKNQRHVMASGIGLTDQEAGGFQFKNLLAAIAPGGNAKLAGFELEICAEMESRAKDIGITPSGHLIPVDVLSRPANVVTTTQGAPDIQSDVLSQSFIELLRSQLLVRGLGATVLSGLEGNVSIPRQIGGATASWNAEGAQAGESALTLDNVNLSPKAVTGRYIVTKQMLLQGSNDIEALLRQDLSAATAEAIDFASVFGSGVGNEPLGILNTLGVAIVPMGANGAALTNVDLLIDMVTKVKSAKAARGSLAFLTNALVEGLIYKLKETTGGYLIGSKDTETPATGATLSVRGYDVATSEQVPSNFTKGAGTGLSAAIFGNWKDLMIGEWGALDVQVNPYSRGIANLEVEVLQFCDIGVRHPASFAVSKDIIA